MKQLTLFLTLILTLLIASGVQAQTETPTPTPAATATLSGDMLMVQISNGLDDVNESDGTLTADAAEVWVGNGDAVEGQYLGLRFRGLSITRGSVIQSAYLEFYTVQEQWITISAVIAAEASDNSPAFAQDNLLSKRELTIAQVDHESNIKWEAESWQPFDEMAAVVQEVVDRSGWRSGNNIAFILKGTQASGDFGRKFFTALEGGASFAARLVVIFIPAAEPEPTASPTVIPTASSCSAAPERLVIGQRGRVLALPDAPNTPLNVRQTPTVTAPRIARLAPGVSFAVLDGPVCVDGIAWFEVGFGQPEKRGWIAEGQGGVYFVEPVG